MNNHPEFTYKDDADYERFCKLVEAHCGDDISSTKLYGLWFVSKTFLTHWKLGTGSDGSMLWSAFRLGWAKDQGAALIRAWWEFHGNDVTEGEFNTWKSQVLDTKWQEAQAFVQKVKMEKQKTKLSYKIREALKAGPSTNDLLAKKLGQNLKAVESHTFRMAKSGELKKLRRGVYADPAYMEPTTSTTTAATPSPIPSGSRDVERRCELANPVNELNTPAPSEKRGQPSGPEEAFAALYQQTVQEWKWTQEKFTEMYYKIGGNAIEEWLAVYRANTRYIRRLDPAKFENLVTELGIEQIESVVLREKRNRERIEEQNSIEIETNDDDDDDWGGYPSMEAKPLPTAEAKRGRTAEPKYR